MGIRRWVNSIVGSAQPTSENERQDAPPAAAPPAPDITKGPKLLACLCVAGSCFREKQRVTPLPR
jgi:hypothetical protein